MKKKVSPLSIAALAFAVKTMANAKQRILDFIDTRPGCSREEITAGTGIKLRSVTGNVTHLIDKQAVVEDGTKLNETGRTQSNPVPGRPKITQAKPCLRLLRDRRSWPSGFTND